MDEELRRFSLHNKIQLSIKAAEGLVWFSKISYVCPKEDNLPFPLFAPT